MSDLSAMHQSQSRLLKAMWGVEPPAPSGHLTRERIDQMIESLQQDRERLRQVILTKNPETRHNWIYEKFIGPKKSNIVHYRLTLDLHYIGD